MVVQQVLVQVRLQELVGVVLVEVQLVQVEQPVRVVQVVLVPAKGLAVPTLSSPCCVSSCQVPLGVAVVAGFLAHVKQPELVVVAVVVVQLVLVEQRVVAVVVVRVGQ